MTPDTVLIIDDDQQLGNFIGETLLLAGFNVELATLGRDDAGAGKHGVIARVSGN